jgi:outer membrane protein assembly factor BamB
MPHPPAEDPAARRRGRILAGAFLLAVISFAIFKLTANRSPNPEPAAVRVVWAFEPPERGSIISSPCVAGGRVYVAAILNAGLTNTGRVYCLDALTKKVVWQFDDDGGMLPMYSTPCVADGRLYVGEGMHANLESKLYCLDAATGRELWHFATAGHVESSPCVAAGGVYFGAGDDGLYCLDAVTGSPRWHHQGPIHIDSSPAVADGRVYAGSGVSRNHKTTEVFCLDAANGRVCWRTPTDLPAWGSPVIDGDDVFFGLGNGRLDTPARPPERPAGALLCVSAGAGNVRWRYSVGDAVLARPAAGAGHVYFGSRDGNCYCLDRAAGTLCWKDELGSPLLTAPALAGQRLYVVACGGLVRCLDAADGRACWNFDVARLTGMRPQLFSSPAVVGEPRRLYFGAEVQSPVGSAAVLYCLGE